jgi:hypothetical protein
MAKTLLNGRASMLATQEDVYWKIREYTADAKGIAYDTCHKIYILMDDNQVSLMREYGYDPIITSDQMDPAEMATLAALWFSGSCALRFVNAVYSDMSIGHDGFVNVIAQFESDEEDDEYDEDEDE